jgi:starch phosphorylase
MNEGHVAFLGLERIRERVLRGESLAEAGAAVARNAVFTTHTPVPAGNETFDRELVRHHLEPWAREVGCDPEDALALGVDPANGNGSFNLTVLAIRLSSAANGVSRLHGQVSSAMWRHLWPGAPASPVAAVTNGVHTPSWVGPEFGALYTHQLGDWTEHLFDPEFWTRIRGLSDAELWAAHRAQKERMIRFARERIRQQWARHGLGPGDLRGIESLLDNGALTIGFARRFATYKRAVLVLSDLERLKALLSDAVRPVQMIFAGKAHPADRAGQDQIRRLFQLTQGDLRGKLVFLEDYDIEVGRMLVQGCDLWLNTPRRPQEASGTSGQKVPVNGGINLSVPDGWWAEAYGSGNGWSIGGTETTDPEVQDREDAAALYATLEEDVIPLFFERDGDGLPRRWIQAMKASIESVVPHFSAHRMVRDYAERFYYPAANR